MTFGKQYRLEVTFAASAVPELIWSRQLAKRLDLPENQVSVELGFLLKLGALVELPAENDRRKLYQAAPHPIWSFVREMSEQAIRGRAGEGAILRYLDEFSEGASRAIPERPG